VAVRRTALVFFTLAWSFLLLEVGVRAYFSIRVGPDVFLWGTQWHRYRMQQQYMLGQNVFEHDNVQAGYSKYHPNQNRTDVDQAGVPFAVTINQHGFRGADHTLKKPAGTFRVLALGASSTFGFGNQDDETYPFMLQELLTERLMGNPCGDMTSAELINLGIPHLNSMQVAELLATEGFAYEPDAITIYSGYNNTLGLGQDVTLKNWSRNWLVINFIRVARQQSLRISESLLLRETEARTHAFTAGLERILEIARNRGIAVLPITQQMRALPAATIYEQRLTYVDEIAVLEKKLKANGDLSLLEGKMLIHQSLTRSLRQWAKNNKLELIDGIELLDEHRHLLSSYVHLSPLANQLLALAITDGLAAQFGCPQLETPLNQVVSGYPGSENSGP